MLISSFDLKTKHFDLKHENCVKLCRYNPNFDIKTWKVDSFWAHNWKKCCPERENIPTDQLLAN